MIKRFIIAGALLLPCAAASAQTVSFKITPPAGKPKLAEPFSVGLEITYPAAYSVRPDTSSFSNEVFELRKIIKSGSRTEGPLRTDAFDLSVYAFDVGISTFPQTAWLLTLTGAAELKEAKSPAFNIEILPLFDPENVKDGIRDIIPPFIFPPWLWILAGLLAAALTAYLIYRRRKAAGALTEYLPAPDLRSPYQKALDSLEGLSSSETWEKNRIKEFYSRLSDIFRTYLYDQFSIKAELLTTNDITKELRRTGAEIKAVIQTRELLETTDLVKFARFKPGEKERDAAVSSLKELLALFARLDEAKRAAAAEGGKQ